MERMIILHVMSERGKDVAGGGNKYLSSTKNVLGTMLDPRDHQR